MKVHSSIDNVKLEQKPNCITNDDVYSVRPSIAKPHVVGRCGKIRKTAKRFDLEKKMWRESYILLNFLELIVYKVMKGYPCKFYKIITKYKVKFYDRK